MNLPTAPSSPSAREFHYSQSDSFIALLTHLNSTLLVSTYQANKLLAVRASGAGLSTLVRTFDKPMGLAADSKRLAMGTRAEVWFFSNAADIARQIEPPGAYDACYVPRSAHVTGDIGIHEIAWADSELWIVSTRFSCLCTLDPDYSFVPRWRPSFISALAAEDRCHLNGLAMVGGQPGYVTALGTTDTRGGWRDDKVHGGCVIHVPSGELISQGLAMPHSPRWHNGQLWILESGTGGLQRVDRITGSRETVIALPGFTRGLAFSSQLTLPRNHGVSAR